MLKRLELFGFKSFANKTVLEFPSGITAIVGPNGSGKSNVIDALRWLLGERDAKNLRGGRGEDLIFAGTPVKPRMGLAQATICFDNQSGFFPMEFAEVAVSREVARSGDSRYYLNKSEVRLRDIIDFFSRVRLGARGLSVIGQGASDLFLAATPKERREMIEEIIGLREFQLKKAEAERKHEATRENIGKVTALLDELTPHLRMLRRQTSKWERRAMLEDDLAKLSHSFFGVKLAEIKTKFGSIDPDLTRLDSFIAVAEEELKKLESEVQKIEAQSPEARRESLHIKNEETILLAKKSALEKELGRLEAKLEFVQAQLKDADQKINIPKALAIIRKLRQKLGDYLGLDIDVLRKELSALAADVEQVFEETRREEGQMSVLTAEKDKAAASLTALTASLDVLRKREQTLVSALEAHSVTFKQAFTAVETKKAALFALHEEKNKLLFERERWKIREEDIRGQLVQSGLDFHSVANSPVVSFADLGLSGIDDAEKKIFRLRGELASIGEIDEATRKEALETEERHAFLSAQLSDLTKALADLESMKRDLSEKISHDFEVATAKINTEFGRLFELMFGGGKAKLRVASNKQQTKSNRNKDEEDVSDEITTETEEKKPEEFGVDVEVSIPRKRITGLEMLSGGERSLVSIAALFAMVSVSPPPFLVLDEIDAALDERNARRFAEMLKSFAHKTQFVVVTHNRATMEAADVLYGVTMGKDGTSQVLSLKLQDAPAIKTA